MYEGKVKVVAVPESREIGAFKDDGAEGYMLTLRVAGPPESPLIGAEVTWIGWLTDAAIERTAKTLKLLGWTGGKSGADIGSLDGLGSTQAHCVLSVKQWEKRDGTKQDEQDVYIPLPEDAKKSSFKKKRTEAQIQSLGRAYEGKLAKLLDPGAKPALPASRATAPANGRGAPPPPPYGGGGSDSLDGEDEIPFIRNMTLSSVLTP